jgi:dolichyl-phosphate-mannose--protein O-mannosyl transferase
MLLQRLLLLVLLSNFAWIITFAHEAPEDDGDELNYVTCGSIIKLKHVGTGSRLHSHAISYGTGSGQQSVTGFPGSTDPNSYWIVRGSHNTYCPQGYNYTLLLLFFFFVISLLVQNYGS